MRYLSLVLCFLFVINSSFAQTATGTIDCMPGESVPAWEKPGSMVVVRQLSYGRIVGILGMESGYIKIQISEDLVGYVKPQHVRAMQTNTNVDGRIAELETQISGMKRQMAENKQTAASIAPSPSPSTSASPKMQFPSQTEYQSVEVPKAEIFGGYSFVHLDNGMGNIDGWNATIAGNISEYFGIKGEFSGLYGKDKAWDDLRYNGYLFMAGPQISTRARSFSTFGHALFGVAHISASAPFYGIDLSGSVNAFSLALGGGIDWHGQRRIGWRVAQVDYLLWRALGGSAHNIRVTTGLMIRFH